MQLPGPVRAAVGLVATAADEARHLPDRAIELPMLAVSTALQVSLRLQQRYARFTARGDAILRGRRGSDEPPDWATFDEPVSNTELRDPDRGDSVARSTAQTAANAGALLEKVFGVDTPENGAVDAEASPKSALRSPPADSAAKDSRTKASIPKPKPKPKPKEPRPKEPAQVNRALARSDHTNGRSSAASRSSVARTAAKKSTKTVSKPRHAPPSRFDAVDDAANDDGDA